MPAGGRIGLNWASANRDETVFEDPDSVRLDRRPNPHVAFGTGTHFCLGAPHARLLLRTLLEQCAAQVRGVAILEAEEKVERTAVYARRVGFEVLQVRVVGR